MICSLTAAERQGYPPERVDTAALLRDVVESLASPPGFTVTINGGLPIIAAERAPLLAVFRNLIENTLKHHPDPQEGHASIAAHASAGHLSNLR